MNSHKTGREYKYESISVSDAKKNEDYWRVVENMFREQAARVLQRKWRKKKNIALDSSKYQETLRHLVADLRA